MTDVMKMFGMVTENKYRALIAFLLIPILFTCMIACPSSDTVLSRVDSILNEVAPALQIIISLLPLLTGKNIPPNVQQQVATWVTRVQNDIPILEDALKQYQNDLTNPSTQAKINALISTTEQDIISILPVFQVVDKATQDKITQIVTAIAAGVASVENIVAAAEGKVSLKVAASQGIKDGKSYKALIKATLHAPTGDQTVDVAVARVNY